MSDYVRYYEARNHEEKATTSLAWKGKVLMQKWKISETRDIYCDEKYKDYSHTEDYYNEEWRPVPVIDLNET